MSALNPFLRAAESRALAEHEARLAAARTLNELPDNPVRRAHRVPPEQPLFRRGSNKAVPMSVRITVLRASRAEGVTHEQLGERFGCSSRTILRLLKGLR